MPKRIDEPPTIPSKEKIKTKKVESRLPSIVHDSEGPAVDEQQEAEFDSSLTLSQQHAVATTRHEVREAFIIPDPVHVIERKDPLPYAKRTFETPQDSPQNKVIDDKHEEVIRDPVIPAEPLCTAQISKEDATVAQLDAIRQSDGQEVIVQLKEASTLVQAERSIRRSSNYELRPNTISIGSHDETSSVERAAVINEDSLYEEDETEVSPLQDEQTVGFTEQVRSDGEEEVDTVEVLPPVLAELFQIDETFDEDEMARLNMMNEVRAEKGRKENTFMANLAEYIEDLPEKPDVTAEEQPGAILGTITEVAQTIQSLQRSETTSEVVIQEVTKELKELCVKLLESLDIQPEEKTVTRMIEKILTSDLSGLTYKKLTPQELEKLGTHEYKLEDWFHKFRQLLDSTLHFHRLVGRVALRLNMGVA